jgi:hypothetical protein
MVKQLFSLIFLLPILANAQADYTVTRNYPNIDRPIQFHIAPKVDVYGLGGLLRLVANTNIDIKNNFGFQAALGTRLVQFGSYAYSTPVAESSDPERFISYSNFGVTWYFSEKIKTKEINLTFSRVNNKYKDVKVPVLVSKSWGLRLGHTGYQQWVQVKSKDFYAINKAESNDTNYLSLGESFTFQNSSMIYAGIDYRKIINSIFMIDNRKVSVRTITDFYFDLLYSTGINFNHIKTASDDKIWKLSLWEENYHKAGFLAGCSFRKPQGNGAFGKIELGVTPKKGPYIPAYISLTLGWGFGIKSEALTKKIPG